MQHPDHKYIDALLHNNETLLKEIYERFGDTIKRMVILQGGNETDAADIFQDALVSIYNRAKKSTFILTCPFEGFLHLICKRKWLKEMEKKKRHTVTINEETDYGISTAENILAEECLLDEARKNLVVSNIVKLGEKCKELLYLSWEDKSMEEVATLLGVSYGYARKRKSECIARLIQLIHQSPEYDSLKW